MNKVVGVTVGSPLSKEKIIELIKEHSGENLTAKEVSELLTAAQRELIGTSDDPAAKDTIKGAKAYAVEMYAGSNEYTANKVKAAKKEIIGFSDDEETANTINGAKNYAKKLVDNNVEGTVRTVNDIVPDENGNVDIKVETSWEDIENKPFGIKTMEYEVGSSFEVPNGGEMSIKGEVIGGLKYISYGDTSDGFKRFECWSETYGDKVVIGNASLALPDIGYDSGEPFGWISGEYSNGFTAGTLYYKSNETYTFVLYNAVDELVQISEEYIPESIARVEDIPDVSYFVKSVNGKRPLPDGNVLLSMVTSVNGVAPSSTGAVAVDVGVLSINGAKPDSKGNINIQTAEVVVDENNKLRNEVLPEGYPYRTEAAIDYVLKDFEVTDGVTWREIPKLKEGVNYTANVNGVEYHNLKVVHYVDSYEEEDGELIEEDYYELNGSSFYLYRENNSEEWEIAFDDDTITNTISLYTVASTGGVVPMSMELLPENLATKEHVEKEIAMFDFIKVVEKLPEQGFPNRIFFVPKKDTQTQDLFDEFVWANKGTEESPNWDWEWITTKQIEVDLTNYTTTDKVEELLLERSKKEHEVGSLYLSMTATNPAQIFGFGTWSLIAKNRFLVGAGDTYKVGDTGGEATVKLTAKELPKQEGKIVTHGTYSGTPIADASGVFTKQHIVEGKYLSGSQGTSANSIDVIGYSNGGEGAAHNNIPPYLAVYIWQRTA